MEDNNLKKSDEKPVSTSESNCSSSSDPNLITSKECSAEGSSLLLLTSPQVSPTCVAEDQHAVIPLSDSRVESLVPAVLPIQEQSRGAQSNTIFSMSTTSVSVEFGVQWQILCKESKQLSEKLIAFVNRVNIINESASLAVPSMTDSDEIGTGSIATDSEQMLHAVIKEAVQRFQNFSGHFNKMEDKMKQWVPAIDAAKANEGERLLSTMIKQQSEKIEQELRTQLDEKKAENEQLRIEYDDQLRKKDDDLAKLQENLTWKNDAEEHKQQLEKYKQEIEELKYQVNEYKLKLENSEKMVEKLNQENIDHQNKEQQNKGKIQKLQEREATKEEIIKKQNEVIKIKRGEVAAIIAEVQKLEEVVKQKESDIQKMQQEIDRKKEETEKQIEYSAENTKLQDKMNDLQGKSMYWKGKYEGLQENQQSLNACVKNISDMGKMALKKLPDAVETSTPGPLAANSSNSSREIVAFKDSVSTK